MAVNSQRSMNANLAEGGTDQKYKKVVQDRGGVVDAVTYTERAHLDDLYYGIHEARVKILPDGSAHVTPDFVTTPAANMLRW
jgi:hypothetical protein